MSCCETFDTVDFILLILIPLWIRHGTLVIGVLPQAGRYGAQGADSGGINHASGQKGKTQQTD